MLRSRGSLACQSPYTNNLAEPKVVNIRSICVGLPGIKQRHEPGFVTLRFSVSLIHDSFFRDKQYTIYSISSINQGPFRNTFTKKCTTTPTRQLEALNSFRLGVITQIHQEEWYHGQRQQHVHERGTHKWRDTLNEKKRKKKERGWSITHNHFTHKLIGDKTHLSK